MAKQFDHILLPTTDNWYPNFEGNKVSASLKEFKDKVGTKNKRRWFIVFEGDDDFGMDKIFDDYREARDLFDKFLKIKDVKKEYLKSIGFKEWGKE